MGKMIEETAIERGHTITARISSGNREAFSAEGLQGSDVAIEFTTPESAFHNVQQCLRWGVPVVCGSTGWYAQLPDATQLCTEVNGAFLYASNFSIGVTIFFEINRHLASLMAGQPDYDVSLREVHHTQKKDAPSGTAVTLAEQVLASIGRKTGWINAADVPTDKLSIVSERTDPAPGTHHVRYSSAIDDIEIIHTAHNRKGFALGAVLAAEFLQGKNGVFTMKDVLAL
jgi:4-hydroxy-tetrahydrodipicolinate reductase